MGGSLEEAEWPRAPDLDRECLDGDAQDEKVFEKDSDASLSESALVFRGRRQSASLVAIKGYIADHQAEQNFGVAQVVAEFGVSRATIFRMFEPLGGVAKYILGLRLQRALIELGSPSNDHLRINDIAQSLGFANGPSFARAFRARFAFNPSVIRRNLRAAAAHDANLP